MMGTRNKERVRLTKRTFESAKNIRYIKNTRDKRVTLTMQQALHKSGASGGGPPFVVQVGQE